MAINNTLPGLVSTNPFLNGSQSAVPSIGGATTPEVGGSTTTGSLFGVPYGATQTSTPVTSQINFGSVAPTAPKTTAPAPASTPQTGSTGGINTYGLTSSSPNWYQLQPGETTANYYARTQGQTQTAALAQTQPTGGATTPPAQTGSTGLGTGGGAAPAGMMYNGQGQLVPLDNSQTVNGAGQNTSIASNVATGGGTQTNFPSIVGGLASTSASPSQTYLQAVSDYQQAQQQLEQSQLAEKDALQSNANSPIPMEFQQGHAMDIQAGASQAQSAYAQNEQAAATLAASATGQQGVQQSGLAAAGGLAQPQAANALGTYNPVTGQYSQYGGGTGGGAATAGGVQTQISQGAAVQQMTGIYQQAQGLAQTLTGVINSSGYNPANGIGPATTYANGINQWLQTNSGNPQYQNAANLISEVANKYAAILNQSGGTPTSVSQVQQQIINGLASGQQIETVLGNLAQNAQTSINALQGASQNNAAGGSNGGSGTVSAGGFNFIRNADGTYSVAQ